MSELTRLGIVATILQVVVLFVVIVKSVKLMARKNTVFLPFFFILAMSSLLLSDLYWIAYDTLKPDTQMPIAANEIGECAMILLLSAGLDTILTDRKKIAGEVLFSFIYIAANIALWIVWSGEWLQDILFGIPYIYFLWILIRGMRTRQSLSRYEMISAFAMSIYVVIALVSILFLSGIGYTVVRTSFFVVLYAMMIWLGVKSVRSRDFFVASSLFLWTNLAVFSSPDFYYIISFLTNSIAIPIMYISMKKELAADDLR